jgi:hypothetical protein
MVPQHQERALAEVGDEPRLLVVAQRDAFVVVVREVGEDEDRLLRDRQDPALLRRHRDAVERMRVHHALHVVARRMHRAVDREPGRVDRELRLLQHVAGDVDLDQARSRDLVEHQAVRIDEEVLGPGDLRRDVGEDEIVPAEQGDEAIRRGEIDAGLPLLGRDLALEARQQPREIGGCVHGESPETSEGNRKYLAVRRSALLAPNTSRLTAVLQPRGDERDGVHGRPGGGHATLAHRVIATHQMHTSFDQTLPLQSRWDQQGVEYIRSNIDWCARCSKRLVGLNPGLTPEQAMDLAQDLSQDDNLRARVPEMVAEDMFQIDLRTDTSGP